MIILGAAFRGLACAADALDAFCARHDLRLVFDAAHAFGAAYRTAGAAGGEGGGGGGGAGAAAAAAQTMVGHARRGRGGSSTFLSDARPP